MNFGGLQKLTLIDFPGRIAATLFFPGCNFRCPWCYSSELVLPEKIKNQPKVSEEEVFDFLRKRKGLLEGVVFCGGEPTIHKELPSLAKKIKKMGFLLKLDTNGSNPKMLRELVEKNLLDYVAMDIKAPKEKYSQITGGKAEPKKIEQSIDFLILGKVDYEFRSTIVPGLHSEKDIIEMARWIKGAKRYFLQNFLPEKTLKPEFEKVKPYPEEFLLRIQKTISPLFEVCQVR